MGAASAVLILGARLLFPNLSGTNPAQFLPLLVFLLGQASVELAAVAGLVLLGYVIRHAIWKPGEEYGGKRAAQVIMIVLCLTLVVPMYYLARARKYFWTRLARDAYALKYIARVDDLDRCKRVQDAEELANHIAVSLKGTSYEIALKARISELGLVIERAESLRGGRSVGLARAWNPVANRRAFFELAEAVRLNPQNAAAADILAKLVERLTGDAIKEDVESLCRAAPGELRGASAPLLEMELRRIELSSASDCAAARPKLERAWALPQVGCILAISRQARAPFDPAAAAGWGIDRLPECKAVEAERR
jgi:hypothetical protein